MGRCHDKVFAAVQRWRNEEDKLFKSSCEHFSIETARQELHKDFRCMYPKSVRKPLTVSYIICMYGCVFNSRGNYQLWIKREAQLKRFFV